jgi:integrase
MLYPTVWTKSQSDLDFPELVERWRSAVAPTLKATTRNRLSQRTSSPRHSCIRQQQISNIGRYDVEPFLAAGSRMYCRNTLQGMRASLGRTLSWALACGWIEKNPCAGVKLPRAGKKVIRSILSAEQINALVAQLKEPYSTLVLFLVVTGLRIGESIAIKWSNFDGDVLHVCRRIYEGSADTTKTESADRSLPIPPLLLLRMKALGDTSDTARTKLNGDWQAMPELHRNSCQAE